MEERTLPIVITGHVDHGKSTLIGRLFYDTGCLPPDRYEEIKAASKSLGREVEFAFVMDHLEEERQRGITIDISHSFFMTGKRRYVIIDAPGHKEFLKNMLTGSSQAEAALLLVDAKEGVREQTLRHCYILGFLGIRQVAVLINKMDLVDYSEKRFNEVKEDILNVLKDRKITPEYCIPISAIQGDNVAKRSENLPWYKGPTVLEALDAFSTLRVEEKGLRFPVQDVYGFLDEPLAAGRIEAGVMRSGEEVVVLPEGRKARIGRIKKFGCDDLDGAGTGECIGISLEEGSVKRGDVVVDETTSTITDVIHANVFWMIDMDYELGIPLTLKCATQETSGKIERIFKRFDPATIEVVEKDARQIKPAEIAEVEIRLERPVVVDRFSDIPELGRFVLEHAGHPVAGGIIL